METNKLNTALALFQSKCPIVDKETKAYNYKYANLAGIMEIIQPIMDESGLLISHSVNYNHETQRRELYTYLIHSETGETRSTSYPIPEGIDAQKVGSWMTYLRRYNISLLLNICSDDDDGEKATQPKNQKKTEFTAEQLGKFYQWAKGKSDKEIEEMIEKSELNYTISPDQLDSMKKLLLESALSSNTTTDAN